MLFIGDVHGKIEDYLRIVENYRGKTVQVGDFGAGFVLLPYHLSLKDRWIRGNHDNPEVCKSHPNWISDGTIEEGMMFIGGALSIDKNYRIPGISWWEDEELSYLDLEKLLEKCEKNKPEIMVTHECPESLVEELTKNYREKGRFDSRTRIAFQYMWEIHKPKVWIFGHWHQSLDKKIDGTRFICLNELETMEV